VSIGSVVAEEMKGRALLAVICASVIIVIYVTIRFHAIKFGIAAVIALIHDVTIAAGLVALADWTGVMGDIKINLAMLAAFLTILGYSLNDTIVVFDRIRENLYEMGRKTVDAEVIDTSINQTLSRTFLTSLTTLMVVLVLYLLGGPVLQGLAFTLIVGVLVGTYSSIFIASPILLDWEMVKNGVRIFFKVLFFPVTAPFKVASALRGSSSS
jgi:preprotein translocase SecF subunit